MEGLISASEMAGAALIVRRNGEIVYCNKWGCADIENKRPVEFNTIYWLASMSKPITAVAVMQLVEQGKLRLDTPVKCILVGFENQKVCALKIGLDGSYQPNEEFPSGMSLPELIESMKYVPVNRPVTVQDLLSHCSGMEMGPVGVKFSRDYVAADDNLERRVKKWSKIPLDFQPGTYAEYSPIVGFDILGRIIEVVSGTDLQTYLKENILLPLGMNDTDFILNEEQQKRSAVVYCMGNGCLVPADIDEITRLLCDASISGYFSGAAGLRGPVKDYDQFTSMLCNEGYWNNVQILKPETVELMHRPDLTNRTNATASNSWGLGMMVFGAPHELNMNVVPGTYGWSGAFGTHMFIDPAHKLCATFVMNRADIGGASSHIARKVEKLVFESFT